MEWLSSVLSPTVGLDPALALAVVATLGYLFGRQQLRLADTRRSESPADGPASRNQVSTQHAGQSSAVSELEQTRQAVEQLQRVSQQMRLSLAAHHACVQRFNQSVEQLRQHAETPNIEQLSQEAERILQPTRQLSLDIAHAYDEIRLHSLRISAGSREPAGETNGSESNSAGR